MKKKSRRYDEREVARILDHAADLHKGALVPVAGGRSLEDIKAIATEAGMDATAIEAAATQLDDPRGERWPLVGPAPRVEITGSVEGELDDEGRRQLVAYVQRALDSRGKVLQDGSTVTWRRWRLLGREQVVIRVRRGRTHIEVRGRYRRGMIASFVVGGLAGGLASVGLLELLHLPQLLQEWAAPPVMASAFVAGRTVWGWFSRLRGRALGRVAEQAADLIEDEVEEDPARLLGPKQP